MGFKQETISPPVFASQQFTARAAYGLNKKLHRAIPTTAHTTFPMGDRSNRLNTGTLRPKCC